MTNIDARIKRLKKQRPAVARYGVPIFLTLGTIYGATLAYRAANGAADMVGDLISESEEKLTNKTTTHSHQPTTLNGQRITFIDPTAKVDTTYSRTKNKGKENQYTVHNLKLENGEQELYQKHQLNDSSFLEIATLYESGNKPHALKFKLVKDGDTTTVNIDLNKKHETIDQMLASMEEFRSEVGAENAHLVDGMAAYVKALHATYEINADGNSASNGNQGPSRWDNFKSRFMDMAYAIQRNTKL